MTRIIKLEAQNIKRLKAVSITPEGNVVIVGGKNGQGKSSTLDSIWYALGGQGALPREPLRQGEEEGFSKLTLDNGLVITRRITTKGTSLKVESTDGAVYKTPQTMLDALVGKFAFDPLECVRMKPEKRLELLRELVGLDFTKIDTKRADAYQERTRVNAGVKQVEDRLEAAPDPGNAPNEEVSVAGLMEQLSVAERERNDHQEKLKGLENFRRRGGEIEAEIVRLQEQLTVLKSSLAENNRKIKKAETLTEPKDLQQPVDELKKRISEADGVNARVRQLKQRRELQDTLKRGKVKQKELNDLIEALDAEKQSLITKAKFPIEGLSFGEGEIRFNGVPFEQCSSAEQLRVSVAMAIALNPELKVVLIHDGSLLDKDNLRLIAEMAKEADAQIWIETVTTDKKKCAVIIEDGATSA